MAKQEKALIVGAGCGLSASLARLFATEGMQLALTAQNKEKILWKNLAALLDIR